LQNPKLRIHKRKNSVRGVVFVYQNRPVMTITETVQTAGSISRSTPENYCCDCCESYCCDCPLPCCDCCCVGGEPEEMASMRRMSCGCLIEEPQGCDPCDC
jgi:hypothetical protein